MPQRKILECATSGPVTHYARVHDENKIRHKCAYDENKIRHKCEYATNTRAMKIKYATKIRHFLSRETIFYVSEFFTFFEPKCPKLAVSNEPNVPWGEYFFRIHYSSSLAFFFLPFVAQKIIQNLIFSPRFFFFSNQQKRT